jgi:hypothetical protein
MSDTDLEAVAVRRKELARALSGYEATRTALEDELQELALTERVLVRLDSLLRADTTFPPNYITAEPLHLRAMGVLKSLIPGRGE